MASVNRVDIRDPWAAIAEGKIPGAFAEGGTVFVFPPVRRRNKRGGEQSWTIRVSLFSGKDRLAFAPENIGPAPNPALPGVHAEIDVDYRTVTRDADGTEVAGEPRRRAPKKVSAGKWTGSVRATNAASQALLTAFADYRKKARASAADAADTDANAADAGAARRRHAPRPEMFYPMLVQVLGKSRGATIAPDEYASAPIFVQTKLDGVRVVARDAEAARAAGLDAADDAVVLTSRTAKPYPGLAHIRAALAPMFAKWRKHCEDPLYLDGEVFVPGLALNEISGQARGTGDDSALQYHVFDAYSPARPDAPYSVRREWVDRFFDTGDAGDAGGRPVQRVEAVRVASEAELREQYDRFLAAGFEGAIARRGDRPYESGARNYHSANVLKLKPACDAEFRVVGIRKGTGSHEGAVIWVCEVPAKKSPRKKRELFRVGGMRGWTIPERRQLYALLSEKVLPAGAGDGVGHAHRADHGVKPVSRFERDYPDLCLTVEFAGYSPKTGVPLQPRGLGFKRRCAIDDAEAEDIPAGQDPMRLLLAEE